MFIEFEETPNPSTLKFLPGRSVLDKGTREYKDEEAALASPLAQRLFSIAGVTTVFLAPDFISVSKADNIDWDELKPTVLTAIMEHFTSGQPVVNEESEKAAAAAFAEAEEESEIARQIREIIDTRVKPAVARDGGNIEFVEFDDGVVYLRMEGACAGCPSSTMTLKHGIESMLRHYIPEVERVEQEAAY